MIINSFPSNNANAVAPYVPLGRQPIGQENSDLKISSLKALEQSAATARNENRRTPEDQPKEQGQQAVKIDNRAREIQTNKLKKAEIQAKERITEEKEKAQKAEEAKQNAREGQYQNEQKKELAQQERDNARKSAERVDNFVTSSSKTMDINRRLVEIGQRKDCPQ